MSRQVRKRLKMLLLPKIEVKWMVMSRLMSRRRARSKGLPLEDIRSLLDLDTGNTKADASTSKSTSRRDPMVSTAAAPNWRAFSKLCACSVAYNICAKLF